eukprot:1159195-Pelagomonas_calceolata.AAC.1
MRSSIALLVSQRSKPSVPFEGATRLKYLPGCSRTCSALHLTSHHHRARHVKESLITRVDPVPLHCTSN